MVTQITEGVKISVDTHYQTEYSNAEQAHYMFAYRITIENMSDYTIQLKSRFWNIFDSNGEIRQVSGEGVVGEKPILHPGEIHQYTSGCNLKSPYGFMEGHYTMMKLVDKSMFDVEIPRFNLIASFALN